MKKVLVQYVILVSIHELNREGVESYNGKNFNSTDELKKNMMVEELEAYTLDEFFEGINDETLDVLSENWVVRVNIWEDEKRYNVLDFKENLVKANINQEGVKRYLQGKDESLYLLEEIK